MSKVSIAKCSSYDIEKITLIVEKQFCELEKDKQIIKKGDNVVIKPNLVMNRAPDEATTTHPALIGAIIRAVIKRGGHPIIAESGGGTYTKSGLKTTYQKTGMTDIARNEGAELNFDIATGSVKSDNGRKVTTFEFIKPILDADVVISAAKLKTHGQMTYSGAVKNLFGCVAGLQKPEFHYRFPDKNDFGSMIVDICETVKPSISFLDAIVAMEGNGPTGGTPIELDTIIAGTNPHEVDFAACNMCSIDVNLVPTLVDAIDRGVCAKSIDEIEILDDGMPSETLKLKIPKSVSLDFVAGFPNFIKKPIQKLFTPHPVITKKDCVGCGKCAESCPQHTIKIENRKAVINYVNCIKCFCCHEMCPRKAIEIKRFQIFAKR